MSISTHATVNAPGKCACPSCGAKLTLHAVRGGKSFQCPKCLNVISLAAPAPPVEAPVGSTAPRTTEASGPERTASIGHLDALNQNVGILRQENAALQARLEAERAERHRHADPESPALTPAALAQDSQDQRLQRLLLENASLVKELADARAAVDDLSRIAAGVLGLEGRISDMGRKYIEATTRIQELELALARHDLTDMAATHSRPDA